MDVKLYITVKDVIVHDYVFMTDNSLSVYLLALLLTYNHCNTFIWLQRTCIHKCTWKYTKENYSVHLYRVIMLQNNFSKCTYKCSLQIVVIFMCYVIFLCSFQNSILKLNWWIVTLVIHCVIVLWSFEIIINLYIIFKWYIYA